MTKDEIFAHIYNACNPEKAATKEYYYGYSEARGSSALVQEFQGHLSIAKDFLTFLFTGHIGCGKSSELHHLANCLLNAAPPNKCYFPVLLDMSEYLDDYDTNPIDILLAIIVELAHTLRERESIELKDNYFIKRFDEIKNFFMSDVEINEGELGLGIAKAKIQRLQKDPSARQQVRAALEPKMSTMLEEINTVFDEARLALKKVKIGKHKQDCTDIVFILDNLEKIRKITGFKEGVESHKELFLERYNQLTRMKAHFIYTVPLRLVRSADGAQLEQHYSTVFVLPMIKVIERGSRQAYEEGRGSLNELLQKRLDRIKLKEAFAPDALEFLLTYSGGHVRNLMTFVQNSCIYNSYPITLKDVQKAIARTVQMYSTSIPENHWQKLAKLELSSDQEIPNGDTDYLVMLENLSVLEYVNGGGQSVFESTTPWYAVNPIVRELPKFKDTLAREPAK